jgi:hypothetical protein
MRLGMNNSRIDGRYPDAALLRGANHSRPLGASTTAYSKYEEDFPSGIQAAKIYERIRDSTGPMSGAVRLLTSKLAGADWQIRPAEGGEAIALFFEDLLCDMDAEWDRVRDEAFNAMVVYGASFHEITLRVRKRSLGSKYDDGFFGIANLAPRTQATISDFAMLDDRLLGAWQNRPDGKGTVFIPADRLLHVLSPGSLDRHPRGYSWLRGAVTHERYLRLLFAAEALGAERNLGGLPYMTVPLDLLSQDPNESPEALAEKEAALNEYSSMLQNVRFDEKQGLILPAEKEPDAASGTSQDTGYKFGVVSTNMDPGSLNEVIQRHANMMLQSVNAEQLNLGQTAGSRALGESKDDVLDTVLKAATTAFESAFNRTVIKKLMVVNNFDLTLSPELVIGDIGNDKVEDNLEANALLTPSLAGTPPRGDDNEVPNR